MKPPTVNHPLTIIAAARNGSVTPKVTALKKMEIIPKRFASNPAKEVTSVQESQTWKDLTHVWIDVTIYGYHARYQSRNVYCSCVSRRKPRFWEDLLGSSYSVSFYVP